jgi:2-methylcitrate synthase
MRTLLEIGEVSSVDTFADQALATKRRLMGFGHRVYKAGDPRAAILHGLAEAACRESGQFTPVIAASRIAGWTANIIEQHEDNRLIRPRAEYIGPKRRPYVALKSR